MSPDTEKKVITITLIKNWLKTIDLQDMMGYSKKSSQELRKYLKINRAPFPPELTTRKSSPLLSKKFLPPVKILPMILVQNPNYPLSHWLLFHPQSLPNILLDEDDSESPRLSLQSTDDPPLEKKK